MFSPSNWRKLDKKKTLEMKSAGIAGFVIAVHKSIKERTPFFGVNPDELPHILEILSQKTDIASSYEYYKDVMLRVNGHPSSNPDTLFENLDDQLNQVGIFSLSSSCSVQLLWAHYAEDHKGICIGFSPEEGKKFCSTENFMKVIYSDEIPRMSDEGFNVQMSMSVDESGRPYTSSFKIAFSDKTFQSAIRTKPTCWAYEEEWRYVEPLGGDYEWPGRISEIVFGLKCPQKVREHYINLATRNIPNEVLLYEMVKQEGGNKVVRTPYKIEKTTPPISLASGKTVDQDGNKIKQLSVEQFAHEVMRLLEKRDFEEALYQLDSNSSDSPDSPHLLNLKAMALGMSGDHEGALDVFSKLNNMFPDQPDILYQQSCALSALLRNSEAIELLKKANELDHNDPSIPFNLGVEIIRGGGDIEYAKGVLNTSRLMGHPRAALVLKSLNEQELLKPNSQVNKDASR
ncbi:DUF2971 domain-containing protein [Rhodoferax sp.]|uniref:DUF2971 domain-containing protein n=1 Tax=Rhodoferax sp. TaxID=50421 RepID=UPI00262D0E1E|nr:DUF2971 domain-containing protein [Rhodoferax sp.]MDD2917482.1 DUF2971 domain-containing protein [Rhodoferax sp.]